MGLTEIVGSYRKMRQQDIDAGVLKKDPEAIAEETERDIAFLLSRATEDGVSVPTAKEFQSIVAAAVVEAELLKKTKG